MQAGVNKPRDNILERYDMFYVAGGKCTGTESKSDPLHSYSFMFFLCRFIHILNGSAPEAMLKW